MRTVQDFKGIIYNVLEETLTSVLLECTQTHARVRIRNYGWDELGFIRP